MDRRKKGFKCHVHLIMAQISLCGVMEFVRAVILEVSHLPKREKLMARLLSQAVVSDTKLRLWAKLISKGRYDDVPLCPSTARLLL